jgi:hypothetical protein
MFDQFEEQRSKALGQSVQLAEAEKYIKQSIEAIEVIPYMEMLIKLFRLNGDNSVSVWQTSQTTRPLSMRKLTNDARSSTSNRNALPSSSYVVHVSRHSIHDSGISSNLYGRI